MRTYFNPYHIFIIIIFCTIFSASAFAANITLNGNAEYIMTDNETVKEAQDIAFENAMRSIAQQAGAYIKTRSKTDDAVLTEDEIISMANAVTKVTDKRFQKEILADGKLKITAFVTAEIDEEASDKILKERIAAYETKKNYKEISAKRNEQLKEKEAAQKEYENIVKYDNSLLGEGEDLKKNGKLAEALASFNNVIATYPEYSTAYVKRGEVYLAQKKYDLAEKDFNKALELDDKDADAFYGKAELLDLQGKSREAVTIYTKFIDLANIVEHNEKIQRALRRISELEAI